MAELPSKKQGREAPRRTLEIALRGQTPGLSERESTWRRRDGWLAEKLEMEASLRQILSDVHAPPLPRFQPIGLTAEAARGAWTDRAAFSGAA